MTVIVRPSGGRWAGVDYAGHQSVNNVAIEEPMVNAGFARWAPGSGPALLVPLQARVSPAGSATVEDPMKQGSALAVAGSSAPVKYKRRPTHLDGLAQGHSLASIWANDREIYVPRDMTATGATWDRIAHAGGFTTAGLSGVQFAGGFFQIVPGYNGPAFDISVTTGGTATTYTINIVNGRLDTEALEQRLSMADAGTLVPVRQLYDQSGAGNHAVKDTLTGDLYIDWDEVLGSWVLVGDFPTGALVGAGLKLPDTVATNTRSFSLAVAGRYTYGCDDSQGSFGLLGKSRTADAATTTLMTVLKEGLPARIVYTTGNILQRQSGFAGALPDQQPCVAVMTSGAANVELTVNGRKATSTNTPVTAAAQAGGWIGTDNPASNTSRFGWRMAGCIITNAVITDDQITRLTYGACRDFNVRPQVTDSIYILADSRNANSARLMRNWPHMLANLTGQEWRVLNMGVATQTAEQAMTRQMAQIAVHTAARPGAKHVAAVFLGINEFLVNSRTPEQAYSYIQAVCANARVNGCTHVVVLSELSSANAVGGANVKLPQLRSLIEAGGPAGLGADRIVSVADMPGVADTSNTSYYHDGTHITERIHSLVASAIWAAIQSL